MGMKLEIGIGMEHVHSVLFGMDIKLLIRVMAHWPLHA